MKRRADRIRWGQTIAHPGGKPARVDDIRRVYSTLLCGDAIEITLSSGDVIRRTPGSKLDVIATAQRGRKIPHA